MRNPTTLCILSTLYICLAGIFVSCEKDDPNSLIPTLTQDETLPECSDNIFAEYNIEAPEREMWDVKFQIVKTRSRTYAMVSYVWITEDNAFVDIYKLNDDQTATKIFAFSGFELAFRNKLFPYEIDNLILMTYNNLYYLDCLNNVPPEILLENVVVEDADVSPNGSIAVLAITGYDSLFTTPTRGQAIGYMQNRFSRIKYSALNGSGYDPDGFGSHSIYLDANRIYYQGNLEGLSYQIYKTSSNGPPEFERLAYHPFTRGSGQRLASTVSFEGPYFYQSYVKRKQSGYDSLFIFKSDLLAGILDTNFYISRVDAARRYILDSHVSGYGITLSNQYIGLFKDGALISFPDRIKFYCSSGDQTIIERDNWQSYSFKILETLSGKEFNIKVKSKVLY